MRNIYKLILAKLVLLVFIVSCSFEVPQDPFVSLDNEEVMKEFLQLDEDLRDGRQTDILLKAVLSEEILELITEWKWELKDILGNTIEEGTEASFEISKDLAPEEYLIVLTIKDEEGNSRVFVKEFFILAADESDDYQVIKLNEGCDTGISDKDGVTNKNDNLTIWGKAPVGEEVVFTLTHRDTESTWSFDGVRVDGEEVKVVLESGLAEGFIDGLYIVCLSPKADDSKKSRPYYLTIDTEAPVLEWALVDYKDEIKYLREEVPANIERLKGAGQLYNIETSMNFDTEKHENSFNNYLVGEQVITINAEDLAGNKAQTLTRTLTVLPPDPAQSLANPGFEDATGLASNEYTTPGGEAPGWTFDLGVNHLDGGTGTNRFYSGVGGPFRHTAKYYENFFFAGVRSDLDTGNNVFWFSTNFRCAKIVGGGGLERWYTRTWGSAAQKNIEVFKGHRYKFSARVKNGTTNRPNPAGSLGVVGPSTMSFEYKISSEEEYRDEFGVGESLTRAAIPTTSDTEDWEDISMIFIPSEDGLVDLEYYKTDNSGKNGCWTLIDDFTFEVQYDTLSP